MIHQIKPLLIISLFATTKNKSKVVDDDSLVNEVAEVYLDLREEYLEVLENKQMNEWNEEKADALKDLKRN